MKKILAVTLVILVTLFLVFEPMHLITDDSGDDGGNGGGDEPAGPGEPGGGESPENITRLQFSSTDAMDVHEGKWIVHVIDGLNDEWPHTEWTGHFTLDSQYEEDSNNLFNMVMIIPVGRWGDDEVSPIASCIVFTRELGNVYLKASGGPVNQSINRSGDSSSGSYRLTIDISHFLQEGRWWIAYITNAPHVMDFRLEFEEPVLYHGNATGYDSTFIYDTEDFDTNLGAGGSGGNTCYEGTLSHNVDNTMLGMYFSDGSYTGSAARTTRISLENPDGSTGWGEYYGAAGQTQYFEDGEMDEKCIYGEPGKWDFAIGYEAGTDVVYLPGASMDVPDRYY